MTSCARRSGRLLSSWAAETMAGTQEAEAQEAGFLEEAVVECCRVGAGLDCGQSQSQSQLGLELPAGCLHVPQASDGRLCHRPAPARDVTVPSESIAHLLEVYSFLRSFSQVLFLSPFSLPELVCSLCLKEANALSDCIHVSLLQAVRRHVDRLARDDSPSALACLRMYDWDFLDAVTWPAYMLAYLATATVSKGGGVDVVRLGIMDCEYYQLDVAKKVVILKFLCDNVLESDETKAEVEMRVNLLEHEAEFPEAKSVLRRLRDPASGRWCTEQRRRGNGCLDRDFLTVEKVTGRKKEMGVRGRKAGEHCQQTAVECEGGVPAVDQELVEARDMNYDDCVLCGMDGSLICCDGCPAAYHTRCVGVSKALLPEGDWLCPECSMDRAGLSGLKDYKGLRGAEVLGVDPQGHLYTAVYGYLLVSDSYLSPKEYHLYDVSDVHRLLRFFQDCGPCYDGIRSSVLRWWEGSVGHALSSRVMVDAANAPVSTSSPYTAARDPASVRNVALSQSHDGNCQDPERTLTMSSNHRCRATESAEMVTEQEKTDPARCSAGGPRVDTLEPVDAESLRVRSMKRDSHGNMKGPWLDVLSERTSEVKACAYVNQYALGDAAASAAASLAVMAGLDGIPESTSARKKSKSLHAADQIKAFSQGATQFYWPHNKKKQVECRKERCGWCIPCKSSSRRGCLLNLVAGTLSIGAALVPGGLRFTRGGCDHLPALVAYVLHMEESLDGLLTGPWEYGDHRKNWRRKVELAVSLHSLKTAILQMGSSLRLIALSTDWTRQSEHCSLLSWRITSYNAEAIAPRRGRPGRQPGVAGCRPKSVSDGDFGSGLFWMRGGKLSRQLIRSERLPSSTVRRAGRQGGLKEVPELIYAEGQAAACRSLKCAWQSRLEMAINVAQLAVQVRQLDKYIKWNDLTASEEYLKSEDGAHRKVILKSKTAEGGAVIYLVGAASRAQDGKFVGGKKRDPKFRTSGNALETGIATDQTGVSECPNVWTCERDVPLHLVRDFEKRARSWRHMKLTKCARRFQNKRKTMERGSFWASLCAPLPPEVLVDQRVTLIKDDAQTCPPVTRRKAFTADRKLILCQICKTSSPAPNIHNPTENVCQNCLALRTGKRRRKPTYKMLQLIDNDGLMPSKTKGRESTDQHIIAEAEPQEAGRTRPILEGRNQCTGPIIKDSRREPYPTLVQAEKPEGTSKYGKDCNMQTNLAGTPLHGLTFINDLSRREIKLSAKHRAYRRQRLLLAGQRISDPSAGPRCYICWQEYNPALSYIGCGFCHEWFHADSMELSGELLATVIGFKCCKCRKVCSPSCPHGESIRRQRSRKCRARVNVERGELAGDKLPSLRGAS